MLEERNESRGDADDLFWRDVKILNLVRRRRNEITGESGRHGFRDEPTRRIQLRVGLRDDVPLAFNGGQEFDLVRHASFPNLPVWGLDKPEIVDARVSGQRGDEPDVRPFRGLDGADAAVMRRMHIAHLEPRALPGQPPRTQRGQPTLVRDLRQRIRLVHELGELAAAEEFLDRCHDRLRIDEIVRQHRFHIQEIHPLLDASLHPHQAQPELVLQQLADRPDSAISQMINVVNLALAHLEIHQISNDLDDILSCQRPLFERKIQPKLFIQFKPADRREIIPFGIVEQVVEEHFGGFDGRGLSRPQTLVDLHHRFFL